MKPTNAISTISLAAAFGAVSMSCGKMDDNETSTSELTGQLPAAFQNAGNSVAISTSRSTGSDSGFLMASLTVPSQVMFPDGSWEIGFQRAVTGHFMVDHYIPPSSHFQTDSNGTMAGGTSPSLALCAGCSSSSWAFGFQGANGHLWIGQGGSPFTGMDTLGAMKTGTSPSIAMSSNGTVNLAFQGANGHLWVGLNGPSSGSDTFGAMKVGTSPAIAVGGPSNQVAIAFHGSNGDLWFGTSPMNGFDTGCALQLGTRALLHR